jgi:hypothetical protein
MELLYRIAFRPIMTMFVVQICNNELVENSFVSGNKKCINITNKSQKPHSTVEYSK